MYDIGDIYEKDGVYFVVTKLINNNLSKSIPLSRYILLNYIGLTENALKIFEEKVLQYKYNKQ